MRLLIQCDDETEVEVDGIVPELVAGDRFDITFGENDTREFLIEQTASNWRGFDALVIARRVSS